MFQPRFNIDAKKLRVGNYTFPQNAGIVNSALIFQSDGNLATELVATIANSGAVPYAIAEWNTSGELTSSSTLTSDASSNIFIQGLKYPDTDGVTYQVLATDGSGVLNFVNPGSGAVVGTGLSGQLASWSASASLTYSNITVDNSTNVGGIGDLTVTGTASLTGITYPTIDGTNGQGLFTDGSGSLDFRSVAAGISGQLDMGIFGTLLTISPLIHVQMDALRGYLPDLMETLLTNSANLVIKSDHQGREFEVNCGSNSGAIAQVNSIPAVRYKPGQGVTTMFTARFSSPIALHCQRAGGVSKGCALCFGINGLSGYGLLYRTGGRQEIRQLSISSPAAGSETATIVLNDEIYNVNLTAGTAAHNSYEIARSIESAPNVIGWQAYQNDGFVQFINDSVGAKSGTYTFSSATAVGSFSQVTPGTSNIDTWVYQTDWDNPDPFDGTTLDPTKGNIYKIVFGYLGYSRIDYYVMHPTADVFVKVHTIRYPNLYTRPNIDSPYFQLGWVSESLGSTTSGSVYGASAMGSVDGQTHVEPVTYAVSNTKTVGTTLTNILTIRVRPILNGFINFEEIVPKILSAAADGTKPVILELYRNATLGGETDYNYVDQDNSTVDYDINATTVSGTKILLSIILGKTEGQLLELLDLNLTLNTGQTLTVAARATSGTSDITASLSWLEL